MTRDPVLPPLTGTPIPGAASPPGAPRGTAPPPLTGTPPPASEAELEEALSRPTAGVVAALGALEGDLLVLGAGGKMGLSLATMARRGLDAAGAADRRVVAVSRFSGGAEAFAAAGVETIAADLLDEAALAALPDASNVLYLAGMKFGASGALPATWAMNTFLPGLVARRYPRARIVALSTGNVYPFSPVAGGGAREGTPPDPVGEYAMSCLGRERILGWHSERNGTPVTLIRLNYANALRYGVLVDIAQKVLAGDPVDVTMGVVNVIWQGDANAAILGAFGLCASPPEVLNVSGPETLSVRWTATRLAELLGAPPPIIIGEEATTALISNSARMHGLFGYPSVPVDQLLAWTAAWLRSGGALLGKPTRFQVRDGRF
jgi:nucleoside-diphosphate-sugar epimerase